ncbi:hypothetical protein HK096_003772 [Nowakowskiella sp. JEL0078]|nr:hypothetical protein HK096_003772 [Nowakowskiella sp. JEL0078]
MEIELKKKIGFADQNDHKFLTETFDQTWFRLQKDNLSENEPDRRKQTTKQVIASSSELLGFGIRYFVYFGCIYWIISAFPLLVLLQKLGVSKGLQCQQTEEKSLESTKL